MGSAYPTLAADALARYYRLRGDEVLMITGCDEHGEKIALTAQERGLEPQALCDQIVGEFKALWEQLGIEPDRFIRTTDPRHTPIVQEFLARVWAKGDIYKADYEGLYCVGCEEFKDPKDLIDDQLCPLHRKPVVTRREENYFFALSNYQQALDTFFAANPGFVQPESRFNEVKGWVKEGLRDFSISRAAVQWGIPLPQDPTQTVYVWFDALLGYVTALLEPTEAPTLDQALTRWPAQLHIIGKDILRFHAVYWPAMLMSAGVALPDKIFGHGHLTKDGLKMGKSLGNVLDPFDLVARYGTDAVRYYFLKGIEFGKDGDFALDRFVHTLNADLANDLGNLLNRTLALVRKNNQSLIPPGEADNALRTAAEHQVPLAQTAYESLDFNGACEAALNIARAGNRYLDDQAPWSLFKKGDPQKALAVLANVLEAVRISAVLLSPITPSLSQRILSQLGCDLNMPLRWEDTAWGGLVVGQPTGEPAPVFLRLDPTA